METDLSELGIGNDAPPQQLPIVKVCWDDLFAFLRTWFSKVKDFAEKPILEIGRYSGALGTYQKLAEWEVSPACNRGLLNEITIACDDYSVLTVKFQIAGKVVADKSILTALTLPYRDLKLRPNERVIVWGHSDGATAIIIDAAIIGKELYG